MKVLLLFRRIILILIYLILNEHPFSQLLILLKELLELYSKFDTDGDGEISLKEFKEGFKKRK